MSSLIDKVREIEVEILRFWDREKIYDKACSLCKGGEVFKFLDGPPYPTGPIHLGHSWNKVMKDILLRFWRMRGYRVNDIPGYDMHGLPIEVQVEKLHGFKRKTDIEKYGIDKFINECKAFALNNAKRETAQFKRLGVWMRWSKPYYTLDPTYIEGVWWTIYLMHKKGRLYRGYKVLGWCPRCQTVLAEHEYEYKLKTSPNFFFKVRLEGEDQTYLVIWTTTPWTIIGNMLIAVHPDEEYVKVDVGGEYWILSKVKYEELLARFGIEEYSVIEVFKGSKLEGVRYIHPLMEEVPLHAKLRRKNPRYNTVITSKEFVEITKGTGCLHVAPSFGPEDFELGLKYGMPIIEFLDESTRFKDEAGIFKGLTPDEATLKVVNILREKDLYVKLEKIQHEYPHCWRCKTPLIFRVTRQWFFKVSDLRDTLVKMAEKTNWIPSWAKRQFIEWLANINDWCISRQRYWGTPLPIWICSKCGYYEVIPSIAVLEMKSGLKITDPHRPYIDKVTYKCPKCGGIMRRIPDVVDVWVDSGSAIWATLPQTKGIKDYSKWETLDFIIEGKDQIRGWFSALFVLATVLFNKLPFKTVYMHGFVTDERGVAMHKSLGNVILPEEVIEKKCAEVLRFYQVFSTSPGEDQKFGYKLLTKAEDYIRVTLNTYTYLVRLSEITSENKEDLQPEDKWLISRINTLIEDVTKLLEEYQLPTYARKLYEFIVDDVSHFYIQIIRDRLLDPNEAGKVYYTLKYALERFLLLMAPLSPIIAEYIYRQMISRILEKKADSIHLLPWPKPNREEIDKELEEIMTEIKALWATVRRIREAVKIKLRWPCLKLYVSSTRLKPYEELIKRVANVKTVEFKEPPPEKHVVVDKYEIVRDNERIIVKIGLDIKETDELIAERIVRDISRHVRAKRKELKLKPLDKIKLTIEADEAIIKLIKKAEGMLKVRAGAEEVVYANVREPKITVRFKNKVIKVDLVKK